MPDFSKISVAEYLGKNTEGLLTKLNDANLDEAATRWVVGQWMIDKAGKSLRTFELSLGSRVAAQDAAARSDFTPTFRHQEWRDGEDLVEAEGIGGFNVRFKALREDLEAVEKDLDAAFQAIAGLRQAISGAFAEFTAELNAINRQVHDCCNKPTGETVGPVRIPHDVFLPPEILDPGLPRPRLPGPLVNPVQPGFGIGIGLDPRLINPGYPGLKSTVWRDAANPDKGVIEGLSAKRIDVTTFNGKSMEVWDTALGLILTESAAATSGSAKPTFVPPALEETREFSRFLFDSQADVTAAFPQGFTTRDFKDRFGGRTLAGAAAVADLVKGLPDDMRFDSVSRLNDAVTENRAKALDAAGLGAAAVVGAVGLNTEASIDEVPIGSVKFTDEATTAALRAGGVKTLGDLARADPTAIKTSLDNAGIATSLGQAAGLRGMSLAVSRMGAVNR